MQRLLTVILISAFAGCAIPDKGIIEAPTPPVVIPAGISPAAIEVNKISQHFDPDDPVDTAIVVWVVVTDQDGVDDIAATSAVLSDPEGKTLSTGSLSDDGTYPDLVANDALYSGKIQLTTTKKQVGNYSLQIQAIDRANQKSNIVFQQVAVINTANNPPILSSLTMPDSAFIPTGQDSTIVKIVVMAADSQGTGDIVSVTGTIKLPNGSTYLSFSLYDDGGLVDRPPFNLTSGDSAANDGRFTAQLLFAKKNVANYTLQIRAKDLAQSSSNVLSKTFSVRNAVNHKPSLSNLIVPDTIFVPGGDVVDSMQIHIDVSDTEGLDDIAAVSLTLHREDGTTVNDIPYPLYDDGGINNVLPFNISSGDVIAGDGVYSLRIPVPSSTLHNVDRDFIFMAIDRASENSDPFIKRVHFR